LNLIREAVSLARNASDSLGQNDQPQPPKPKSQSQLLRGGELWVVVGVLVAALIIPCVALARSQSVWQVVAYAALTVGVVHGVIFAWLWWRYRAARKRTLADARLVLGAKVNTQLMLIMGAASQTEPTLRQRTVQMAAEEISQALKTLSEESIREWHLHHDEALAAAKQGGLKVPA
jgi:hypothetical protein